MALTKDTLRAEVGADDSESDDTLNSCINVARSLLERYAGAAWVNIPTPVQERAWLDVAAELFNQRRAPNGVLNQPGVGVDGVAVPVRIGADPLRPAYGLLGWWVRRKGRGLRTIGLS